MSSSTSNCIEVKEEPLDIGGPLEKTSSHEQTKHLIKFEEVEEERPSPPPSIKEEIERPAEYDDPKSLLSTFGEQTTSMCNECNAIMYGDKEAQQHTCETSEASPETLNEPDEPVVEELEGDDKNIHEEDEEEDWVEDLISEVQRRKQLWNTHMPYHTRSPKITKVLWKCVAKALDQTPGTCVKKWKNLRDRYRKILKEKMKYLPSGSTSFHNERKKEWRWVNHMAFIAPVFEYRKTSTNSQAGQRHIVEGEEASAGSIEEPEVIVHTEKRRKIEECSGAAKCSSVEELLLQEIQSLQSPPEKTDTISSFCRFLESCLRDLSPSTAASFIDETMLRMIKARRENQ